MKSLGEDNPVYLKPTAAIQLLFPLLPSPGLALVFPSSKAQKQRGQLYVFICLFQRVLNSAPTNVGRFCFINPELNYYFWSLRSGTPSLAVVSTLPSWIMPGRSASFWYLPGPGAHLYLQPLVRGCCSYLQGAILLSQLWALSRYLLFQWHDYQSWHVTWLVCANCRLQLDLQSLETQQPIQVTDAIAKLCLLSETPMAELCQQDILCTSLQTAPPGVGFVRPALSFHEYV